MSRPLREVPDHRPALRPPQFTLKVLWAAMTAVCALLVISTWVGPVGATVTAVGGLAILAHVAGAAIGDQLRTNRATSVEPHSTGKRTKLQHPANAQLSDFAPVTQLSHHRPLNRKPIFISVAVGASLAGLMGGALLAIAMWRQLSIVNVLFGACSSAVLGGFFGFWASSFLQVIRGAWMQANRES